MFYTPTGKMTDRLSSGVGLAAAALVCLALSADRANAMDALLGFSGCSNNSATDTAIAEAQMSVKVSDPGGNKVRFDFFNSGPAASSITDVYFDDNMLLTNLSLIDSDDGVGGHAGVDFSAGAAPPDLPAGGDCSPSFSTTSGLLADSDPPALSANGVNPDEFLGILFDIDAGKDYDDVLADLESGALRVGIHVQSFEGGGSESLVSMLDYTGTEIAEPGTLAVFGIGIAGLVYRRRRQRIGSSSD